MYRSKKNANATKLCDAYPRSSIPAEGDEDGRKDLHRISVRKTRDIVPDDSVERIVVEQTAEEVGQFFGVGAKVLEQQFEHVERLFFFPLCDGIGVDAVEHEGMQFERRLAELVRLFDVGAVACLDEVGDHRVDTAALGVAKHGDAVARQVVRGEDAGGDRVLYVVIDICAAVGEFDDFALESAGSAVELVVEDAVAHLVGEVEPFAVVFEQFDHAQTLFVVAESALDQSVEHALAGVPERGMPEVVTERDRLGQILVEAERPCDRARDLRDFERMGEARAVVVALGGDEDLRLVFETAERLGVDDAVAVADELGAHRARREGSDPAARILGLASVLAKKHLFAVKDRLFAIDHTSIISQNARDVKVNFISGGYPI